MSRRLRSACLRGSMVFAALLVWGCDRTETQELRAYIDEVKARPPRPIEPLPEIQPVDAFIFEPDGRRDPFVMDTKTAAAAGADNSLAPDPLRPKEELESYPLDALRMVGTVQQQETRWALVRTREGLIYRVRVGNYLGMNNGQIVDITDDAVRLTEIVSEIPGDWRERSAELKLTP
ncbi:pilus assembly protein PilP [Thiocapsa rosea]|uniref:Type IV pilus assembly protein PilP n=1 Tax=Thiocapsa rosea TaxID=69360 RepID=A0A495V6T7_9GAMM|nr:pilus assembly protein PilP [Thiocapsa rosea]RKT44067.1 type IV pilus assembly protein PilP [Thiocapsa rosea]